MSDKTVTHALLGGKLHVYRRPSSGCWQCSTYLSGKNRRKSTGEDSLAKAKDFAEDWYLELHGKLKRGEMPNEKSFKSAAEAFIKEFSVINEGQRSPKYIESQEERINLHLIPYFGSKGLSEIKSGTVQEYRMYRREHSKTKGPPARSTMHQELVALRQVLKSAIRHGWLESLPDLSVPYKSSGKLDHRAWFSPEEYKQLYTATRKHAQAAKGKRWEWECHQVHEYVLFLANTGLRPDEAARLQYRDVAIEFDEGTNETILVIEVRGKRGVGYCKSTVGAVRPFERLKERNKPKPDALIFPKPHRDLFNTILDDEKLKIDRDGRRRTAYSLRHTYICMRLMEGADIYQVAKNCRTSVEMIENYYASHIKTNLDASAINVRRARPNQQTKQS